MIRFSRLVGFRSPPQAGVAFDIEPRPTSSAKVSNPLIGFSSLFIKAIPEITAEAVAFCLLPGGEGGIRTLEGCYTLPAFQASALDQLCDLSVYEVRNVQLVFVF